MMISNLHKKFNKSKSLFIRTADNGFTLVEVLVAIFIGLIVMGMAVSILGITNSTSLRVLAKSEAQQTTRASVVRVLDNLSNAESLEQCRVGTDKDVRLAILNFPTRSPLLNDLSKCKETSSSGNIVIWAQPNRLCYFNKGKNLSEAPSIQCISRGGNAARLATATSPYNNSQLGMNLTACVSHQPGTNENFVYMFTCSPPSAGSNAINWPTTFSAPTSSSLLADLSPNTSDTVTIEPLFSYTLDASSPLSTPLTPPVNSVHAVDLISIIAVRIEMNIDYDTKQGSGNGNTYRFNQTIVLRGSRLAQEENYNG